MERKVTLVRTDMARMGLVHKERTACMMLQAHILADVPQDNKDRTVHMAYMVAVVGREHILIEFLHILRH